MIDRIKRIIRRTEQTRRLQRASGAFVLLAVLSGVATFGVDPEVARQELSPYMNSIPPSKQFFAVGTGPANRVRHPDRAPHTQLAQQDGVILFSGAAPQLGLNFSLNAGSLIYRNQMSTLGAPEPPPQVGTAGTLLEGRTGDFLPWSEARWHQGEDISWYGYRAGADWIDGLPYWKLEQNGISDTVVCPQDQLSDVYSPHVALDSAEGDLHYGLGTSANLQLARGIYQASRIRGSVHSDVFEGCSSEFREPWFQARGLHPPFNVELPAFNGVGPNERLAKDYYPNYLNIYPYRTLELDGGRLLVDFERSATWPRQPTTYNVFGTGLGGATSGAMLAERVVDEYGNVVLFDRVPKYGWETDYKVPPKGGLHDSLDASFNALPDLYRPTPNAWRLPHKRLRTVQLFSADSYASGGVPDWTVAFVYEHPDSDRISDDEVGPDGSAWKSLYSHLPQSNWKFGRLPELNDQTTLLTVQAYKADVMSRADLDPTPGSRSGINGYPFQDDYFVWGNSVGIGDAASNRRLNTGQNHHHGTRTPDSDRPGATVGSPATQCPGVCNYDDDGDGLIDEDSNGYQAYLKVDIVSCATCQNHVTNDSSPAEKPACYDQDWLLRQTHEDTGCKNPLYWRPHEQSGVCCSGTPMDPFAYMDDDEDGLIDEDGKDNPLLVNIRAIAGTDECASGRHPFVPNSISDTEQQNFDALLPGGTSSLNCRNGSENGSTYWSHQVQYVYARTNPYWLLFGRTMSGDLTTVGLDPPAAPATGETYKPKYYYFSPFSADIEGDGDSLFYDANGDGNCDPADGDLMESDLCGGTDNFPCEIKDSLFDDADAVGQPNVHPDCVPDPDFRGAQALDPTWAETPFPAVGSSGVHLIKRIVRSRPDVLANPENIVTSTWLYRYSDIGFLKAVFDPQSVQQIIDADENDAIDDPDDILRYADTHPVGPPGEERPLITYAGQWYTYYNTLSLPEAGTPQCYEEPPFVGECEELADYGIVDDLRWFLPMNACDGQRVWGSVYENEVHTDPACSPFINQNCGWCYAHRGCTDVREEGNCADTKCGCPNGLASDPTALRQMGISGAQPRVRKYKVKTARVRGADGAMHLYRIDYLGAANSVYNEDARISSFEDAHNITIVDEIVEQNVDELSGGPANRSDFYIYEDDFKLSLDGAARYGETYAGAPYYTANSHFLHLPAKVKTRRVVIMNFYGIAISDRLMLTPGYDGDTTSLVDNQRYELTNERGQAKHIYDESWVAQFREGGLNATKAVGRVFTELFGGQDGWHSVLRGIAKGAGGGNLYNQQCKTPEVLVDVPVQRVAPGQLVLTTVTEHAVRTPNGTDPVLDMPKNEVHYYNPRLASSLDTVDINDPAGTIGTSTCLAGSDVTDELDDINLHDQGAVIVNPGFGDQFAAEGDGATLIQYHYVFYDTTRQVSLKWKYRWQEKVGTDQGGTGGVSLELWFFDTNGNIRLYGKGAGTDAPLPEPKAPFYVSYYGFDGLGRPNIQIEDVDLGEVPNLDGTLAFASPSVIARMPLDTDDVSPDPNLDHAPRNFTTLSKYDDIGGLVSTCVGTPFASAFVKKPKDWVPGDWDEVHRTDFAVLASRTIRPKSIGEPLPLVWEDPFIYQIRYEDVSADGESVFGKTTVTMLDKGGRFLERRVIAWNSARDDANFVGSTTDKIKDFGWGISLRDYDYDGAIQGWENDHTSISTDYWEDCDGPVSALACYEYVVHSGTPFTPKAPDDGDEENPTVVWPPLPGNQLVTLSREFKLYEQKSSLKPTADIVYNSYGDAPALDEHDDHQVVMKQYLYDLEDRIARQQDADGSITRLLFDTKRRPTKIFKGSSDECSDWFPRVFSEIPDDMVLTEQRLYNDGHKDCEANFEGLDETCEGVATNEDFPNDAGKLVRVRRFTDNAEACMGQGAFFDPETRSRDTQYVYDWRGRPVITKEVTVGSGGGTATVPHVVSATVTIYDNLDRPFVVATYGRTGAGGDPVLPDLSTIESWEEDITITTGGYKVWAETVVGHVITQQNTGRSGVSATLYDERGRVYELRLYDPDSVSDFTVTKTYRDDLDRVTKTVSPGGTITNKYDSRGRVVETSLWTENNTVHNFGGSGYELTRTVRTYDGQGNVLAQIHYDRKPDADFLTALDAADAAIITYSHNWYDEYTNRLIATANFGTGESDGYSTNTEGAKVDGIVISYNEAVRPVWDGQKYTLSGADLTSEALVTLYKYDAVGRRNYVRDPKGIVSKTWFDLLGHTLLVAENWHEEGDGGYEGPTRYTAHHYTRGGLLEMMVAIIPNAANPDLQVVPAGFPTPNGETPLAWLEGDATIQPYPGTEIDTSSALFTVQATRFTYGADVVNESDHSVDISDAPNLVEFIQYPITHNAFGVEIGQPSPVDGLRFEYTIGGQVAQRTDSRGVVLDFFYDTDSACGSCSSAPGNQPTEVRVKYFLISDLDDPAGTVDHLSFGYDAAGRLIQAQTYGPRLSPVLMSEVSYTYDGRGNLIGETLDPTPATSRAKSVSYGWDWYGVANNKQNRLQDITYPTGSRKFNYKYDGQDWTDGIGRMTGLTEGDVTEAPIIDYQMTGGGRNIIQTWGNASANTGVQLDYDLKTGNLDASLLDRFGRIKSMDLKNMSDGTTIHKYEYGYDASGNRQYARIEQAGHPNDRSYLYGYDNVNRLVDAGRGTIDVVNDQATYDPATERTTTAWGLDLLGNWSGGVTELRDTNGDAAGGVEHLRTRSHVVNAANEIITTSEQIGALPAIERPFAYDVTRNLIFDGERFYKYDAWNRIVAVHENDDADQLVVDANGYLSGTPGTQIAVYDYDALGRRIAKTVDTNPTEYFYYDGHRVIEHHEDNGPGSTTLLKQYVYGLNYIDEPVAYYDADALGVPVTTPHFILQDANYDVVGITNDQGTLVQQMTLDPYGDYLYIEDGTGAIYGTVDADISELLILNGRNGLWYDPETGLYYNRARNYGPKLGRFMQGDPNGTALMAARILARNAKARRVTAGFTAAAQYTDGMNLYQFGHSNPSRWTDPTGLDLITDMIPEIPFKDQFRWATEGSSFANLDVGMCRSLIYKELGKDYNRKSGRPTGKGGNRVAWSYIHCVIHCGLVKHAACGGEAFSRHAAKVTEAAQMVACEVYKLKRRIPGSKKNSKKEEECESAWQQSDYYDNERGRDCARTGENDDDCADCCESRLGGRTRDDLPEGPGTSRPYGPYHPTDKGPGWPRNR